MTIASTTNRMDYTGTANTGTYAYSFRILLNTHLLVTVSNIATGVETDLTLTTDYTVTGVNNLSGGNVVLVASARDWADASGYLKATYKITIKRVLPLTQNTDIRNQGVFYPEVHEDEFDRGVMISQQQQDQIDRSLKLAPTIILADFDATIPKTIVGEASVTIITNPTGDGFIVGPTAAQIENAEASAIAAAASADAASDSADAAAASVVEAEAIVDAFELSVPDRYDAVVGLVGTDPGATHNTLVLALAAASAGWSILVVRDATINVTPVVSLANIEIVFKRGVTYTKGSATAGLEIDANDCKVVNGRFKDFSTGGDCGVKVNSTKLRTFLSALRFNNCDSNLIDNGTETYSDILFQE